MFNYEVDPSILLPYLPPATELDLHNGKALVSVVGFMFTNTKVLGISWPFHINFEEVNLRLYVKHFDGKAWKRGVVFVSEIVPKPIIAFMANTLYHEQYSATKMKHSKGINGNEILLEYQWKWNKQWNSMSVNADASLSDISEGSDEQFIFEHYWGYNKYNNKTTIEYGVEHVSWQVHTINSWSINCDIAGLYGAAFVPFLSAKPHSVFVARGSEVVIRRPRYIRV
jgi:uncharacterized protein YqjF (DUF2071 family)